MAHFAVPIVRVDISAHPDADLIEIAQVGGFQSVVGKGQFKTGDLAAYIPEGAVVPQSILKHIGLEGKLSGPDMNRVKAAHLRGVLSQGILYPTSFWPNDTPVIEIPGDWGFNQVRVELGQDVAELLGIKKYVPIIPDDMKGDVYFAGFEKIPRYDIEDWKKFPEALDLIMDQRVMVTLTEKLHGTWTMFGLFRNEDGTFERIITSKGMADEGKAYILTSEFNQRNLYFRAAKQFDIWNRLENNSMLSVLQPGQGVYIMGETFGLGVQKGFGYGGDSKKGELGFRVFDIMYRDSNTSVDKYLDRVEFDYELEHLELQSVPVLYYGPFSHDILKQHTNGMEMVSGNESHIREGVVIAPSVEMRFEPELGRLKLKSLSEAYLLRKGKGQTEYQ